MNDSGYGRKPPRRYTSVPALFTATRGLLLEDTGTMCRPYLAFGYRKSGGSHRNPGGSHRNRKNR